MRRHYRVAGRVQGVGFRWACQRAANDIGVLGWTRNLDDGDVEVLAEGNEDQLNRLETWLDEGPPGAQVSSVSAISSSPDPDQVLGRTFEILR